AQLKQQLVSTFQRPNVPTCQPYRTFESALRKSPLGLPPELTQIALCALLRAGEVVALDAHGTPLAPSRLKLPLRESVAAVQRGVLLNAEVWAQVVEVARVLLPRDAIHQLAPQTLEEQERLFRALARWKLDTVAEVELLQARLAQLRRQWQQAPAQWAKTYGVIEQVTSLLNALDENAPASVGLQALVGWQVGTLERLNVETCQPANLPTCQLANLLSDFRRLSALLEQHQSRLLDLGNYLTHPDLVLTDAALVEQRQRLMDAMASGERMLDDVEGFLDAFQQFQSAYMTAYVAAHAAAHDKGKFLPYIRYRESAEYRAVLQIAQVTARACPEFVEMERRLTQELNKWCQRADLATALGLSPICPTCRLRCGESVKLMPLEDLTPIAQECRLQFLAWLNESSVAQRIRQYAEEHPDTLTASRLTALLRAPLNASAEDVLTYLTDETVSTLNALLAPTRRVTRRLRDLHEQLIGRRLTKAQALHVYQQWLDGDEKLRAEDEVWMEE
ncbi:MAG: DUF6079 family protein, partial [Abditibacteriales bacterium]|nr:DUF6079 family protein [Abditibacteriales bacterium]MDW8367793.1 DUF6079 family protein [Abditibacteriales bacterium]